MNKKIIIIGSGISGLSSGIYSQMNNYNTQIFEMHSLAGGLCTSWKRKNYTIDGCVHWLVGSNIGNSYYNLWKEVGVIKDRIFIDHDEFIRIKDRDANKEFIVYTDADKLEKHMIDIAPEDEEAIKEFTNLIRKLRKLDPPIEKAQELLNIIDKIKILIKLKPFYKDYKKYSKITIGEFASKFKNKFLRESFNYILYLPDLALLAIAIVLSEYNNKVAGYPIGGSIGIAKAMTKRYEDLGGKINYKSKVIKIITKDNKAIGIELENGEKHYADIIISAADAHSTVYNLLEGKYTNDKINIIYETYPLIFPLLLVSLGVKKDFKDLPHYLLIKLDKTTDIGNVKHDYIGIQHYSYDPTMSPNGSSVIRFMIPADYEYWKKLYDDKEKYNAEKDKILKELLKILDKEYPDTSSKIDMIDFATPITFVRYTGTWKGTFMGWMPTPEMIDNYIEKTLPGLDNLYLVGQLILPAAGLPTTLSSGRDAVQIICKKDRKVFKTITPD